MEKTLVALSVIVLAAGQGTRMNSTKPKVLQQLAGKPLLHHVLLTAQQLVPEQILVVCGYRGEELQKACQEFKVDWVWQTEQRGTGHAVQVAYPDIVANNRVLVLYGDVPLISTATLKNFINSTPADALGILTAQVAKPQGLGRIIRDSNNKVIHIIEHKDASPEQQQITEINTGIYLIPQRHLAAWLANLKPQNSQQEYYLTDIIALAVNDKVAISDCSIADEIEITGVNSQQQLAMLERQYQLTLAQQLLEHGVKVYDPNRLDIRGVVNAGKDCSIDVNVVFEGTVVLGDNVQIGANVFLKDCVVESDAVILPFSMLDNVVVGIGAQVGPFARLRPGTRLHAQTKVGNFVEIKNSNIGVGTKVNHLSYIGDAQLGSSVNIGAGVITCNYDGAHKHQTIIEDEVFIGSNCELIAPVRVGKGATLAAGTTLLKDAPPGGLTLTKKMLTSILDWRRPTKAKASQTGEK
jgi:bifunctional UDP-N-acetylglucosamine pyrophosphorylase / glucosamine-1-phosphate N-acetyltransferase